MINENGSTRQKEANNQQLAIDNCRTCDVNGYFLTPCRKWNSKKGICDINFEGTCGNLCDKKGNKKQLCPHQ